MSRTPHPGKTPAQRPPMARTTLAALLSQNLIEPIADKVVGADRFGPIRLPQYQITVATHIAWCEAVAGETDG